MNGPDPTALAIWAVADETEVRIDTTIDQAPEREDNIVRPLDGRHATDPADDEHVLPDAERAARLRTHVLVYVRALVELAARSGVHVLCQSRPPPSAPIWRR